MKRFFFSLFMALFAISAVADTIEVNNFNYAGPFNLKQPVMMDSLNLASKKFSNAAFLDKFIDLSLVRNGREMTTNQLPKKSDITQMHLIGFTIANERYAKADFVVKGMKHYHLYVDGKKNDGKKVELTPAVHDVVVKYLTDQEEQMPMWGIKVTTADSVPIMAGLAGEKRSYQLSDVLHCWRFNKVSLSPDGNFLIAGYSTVQKDGKTAGKTLVKRVKDGVVIDQKTAASWMPTSNKYYFIRQVDDVRSLVTVDPETHQENVLIENLPEGGFTFSPTEDYMIFNKVQTGPKESKDVYQVLEPDDRQPNWRNKTSLDIYDLKSGICTPLVYGNHSVRLLDISEDGKKILVYTSRSRLEKRPTTVYSLFIIDHDSYQVDTLITDDGFFSSAAFSPDATKVMLTGSPEAFGGVGNVLPQGRIPSMTDTQLYIMDLKTRDIKPMTRDFNPNVVNAAWNKSDGMIYFIAEDKDCIPLFQLNPKSGNIKKMDVPEDLVSNFSCAANANAVVLYGQSASNSDRMYVLDTKKEKTALYEDLSKETLKNIKLGECQPWNYLNDRGDTICCRFYLPPNFNAEGKYPVIVNYYGGCSPTSRNFESRYPHHAYAAQGYVVLVVNPSGATGFGQEFASRHVNTAGEGVAEDIIGATKEFLKSHPFTDPAHVGCIGASYGGFMTQYLQTKTDIFAAAISHAGISDHTSYWGEGYWGYSYSEVSMAGSYPWTDRHLYVDQSPLFNADKINTPILFLHGNKDNNVPVGESIQMFTALKLLGKPTALVLVDEQDHHILDYHKRIKWQNTIFAWFAKYLKNDESWWKAIYTQPNL